MDQSVAITDSENEMSRTPLSGIVILWVGLMDSVPMGKEGAERSRIR